MVFAIHQHELAIGIHVSPSHLNPSPNSSPPHPSGLSQITGFGCLASCTKLVLVICLTYGNIHVSVLFSQIIPSLPSPTESKSLFFTSVCFAALNIELLVPSFWISYIYFNIQYLSLSFWLTSLCIIGSRLIHFIRIDSNVFFFIAE